MSLRTLKSSFQTASLKSGFEAFATLLYLVRKRNTYFCGSIYLLNSVIYLLAHCQFRLMGRCEILCPGGFLLIDTNYVTFQTPKRSQRKKRNSSKQDWISRLEQLGCFSRCRSLIKTMIPAESDENVAEQVSSSRISLTRQGETTRTYKNKRSETAKWNKMKYT